MVYSKRLKHGQIVHSRKGNQRYYIVGQDKKGKYIITDGYTSFYGLDRSEFRKVKA